MTYGYSRCSTDESRQDLNRQNRELKTAGAEIIFSEFEHGDSETKKELDKLMAIVKAGDTVIVTEVSRLSRSTRQLCGLIDQVKQKQIRLQILNSLTIDCRSGSLDPMSEAFLMMSGVFAQLELSMIRARVKSGMENARLKGKRIGRPPMTKDDIPDAFFRCRHLYEDNILSKVELARLLDISRPTLDKYLKMTEIT